MAAGLVNDIGKAHDVNSHVKLLSAEHCIHILHGRVNDVFRLGDTFRHLQPLLDLIDLRDVATP